MSKLFRTMGSFVPYLALTYLALAVNVAFNLRQVEFTGFTVPLFCGAALLAYTLVYMLPGLALLALLDGGLWLAGRLPWLERPRLRQFILCAAGIALFGLTHMLIFTDRFIFHIYAFHINGFVWNLLVTPGGVESMGGNSASTVSFLLVALFFMALQGGLMAASFKLGRLRSALERLRSRKAALILPVAALLLAGGQAAAFGVSNLRGYEPVLIAARVFPMFQAVTFNRMASRLGAHPKEERSVRLKTSAHGLHYPLQPITTRPEAPKYNIVWLVAESWRADMLAPEIMPRTWEFAQRAARFHQHYSAGNGTRMALFGLFYGLYGNYWFPFLEERRGPVLMDLLLKEGYEFDLRTSAKFTYPEFEKTLFAAIPSSQLHQAEKAESWVADRRNISEMLQFLDQRDRSRPFMCFMFFESPHARYDFPPECAIRKPYLDSLNYATMDLERDMPLIFARYVNSCNHLDTQLARVIGKLEQEKLLDSTIVIITGDHGEEFMEKGHWGHNSYYTEEQTRVPLVLWVPGRSPEVVERMTSHLDLPATVMTLLGVTNPPEDYSLGLDLFGPQKREYSVLSSWGDVAYVDSEYKAVFPTGTARVQYGQEVTTKQDQPVADRGEFRLASRERLVQLMREMSRFSVGNSAVPSATHPPSGSGRTPHKRYAPRGQKPLNADPSPADSAD